MSPTSGHSSSCPDDERPSHSADDGVRSGSARADVVVVAYETPVELDRCLHSLTASEDDRLGRIVVVDNSPSDRCAEVVGRHVGVELLRPGTNLGFGRGANLGIATTRGGEPFVFVVNADTVVQPGAIGSLIDHLVAHPTASLAGPSIVDRSGRHQDSCAVDVTPARILLGQTGLWKIVAAVMHRSDVRPFHSPATPGPVPWLLGAALMLDRTSVEAVGGFDPGFHMYFEEVDLSRRLRGRRRETHYVPSAVVAHDGGASTARDAGPMERVMFESLARHMRLTRRSSRLWNLRLTVGIIAGAKLIRSVLATGRVEPWSDILDDARRGWTQ